MSDDEVTELPSSGQWIVATGPLTSSALGESIRQATNAEALAFFDAIAPIVYADIIDMDIAWMQSRYDKGETEEDRTAYLNCPMTKDEYEAFIDALLAADKTEFHEGETAGYFDGCLPIEVMAERGRETLRFGPMKPVGLTNANKPDQKPYAVVQLRRDNALGTLYNIVGFQTKMKYGGTSRCFQNDSRTCRMPLSPASAASTATPSSTRRPCWTIRCACARGPISASPDRSPASRAMSNPPRWGLLAGRMAAAEILGAPTCRPLPPDTAMGALVHHITGGAEAKTFQPMNVNFGLFPPARRSEMPVAVAARTATRPTPTAPKPPGPAGCNRRHWTPPDLAR